MDPNLLMSDEYLLRLLNVTQGLEEFRFSINHDPSNSDNHISYQEYPALFNNFNPTNLKTLSYLSNVPYQYTLIPILAKCGSTLKHLKISDQGSSVYPIDEILSLCPKLLTLNVTGCEFEIGTNSELEESAGSDSSLPARQILPIYPLRCFWTIYENRRASIQGWLTLHCPNLKASRYITGRFLDDN